MGVRIGEMGRGVVVGVAVGVAVAACVVAGVVVGRRVRSRSKWNRVIGVFREFEEGCDTTVGRLRQVVDAMAVEMHAGLASEGGSKLKMLLTFVDNLPSGYGLYDIFLSIKLVSLWLFNDFDDFLLQSAVVNGFFIFHLQNLVKFLCFCHIETVNMTIFQLSLFVFLLSGC